MPSGMASMRPDGWSIAPSLIPTVVRVTRGAFAPAAHPVRGMISAQEAYRIGLGEPERTIVVGSPRELPPTPWTRLHDESRSAGIIFRPSRSGPAARRD
jgi:hypothetical protein